ncbi:immunoglobulin-like domain-containing protein (plasmid) [Clostridium perfringens]
MAEKILVVSQGIETDDSGVLLGEVRSDIEIDMQCLNFQIAIFDKDRAKKETAKITKEVANFYYKDFSDGLQKTKWSFIRPSKISIIGADDKKVKIKFPFDPKEGVVVVSQKDGDISDKVKVNGTVDINTLGANLLTYTASDSDGNEIKVKRTIIVRTNEKPKIKGVDDITITVGDNFEPMKGVTAEDKEDGDLTKLLKVEGKVDNGKTGNYNLKYSVTDSDDNTVEVNRTVTVAASTNEADELRMKVLNAARTLIGKPYVWGGNYPGDGGTDCSGLCQYAYKQVGINITRTTYTQIKEGIEVYVTDLRPGDLIFSRFSSPGIPEHVFMYAGYRNGEHWCVEAPRTGLNIRERKFDWGSDFRARRIIQDTPSSGGSSGGSPEGVAKGTASANIIYYVKGIEGYAANYYYDSVGVKTLGYGMTRSELNGVYTPLNETNATIYLNRNFNKKYYNQVLYIVKSRGVSEPLQREIDAFASFAYNCGVEGFSGSQLLKKYIAGERGESIHNEFKKWVHGNGQVLPGLVRRREEEWRIFSGSSEPVAGYNCRPQIDIIGTNGRPTGALVTDNGGYGASPE